MTDKVILFSTAASPEEAERLARALVERRAAACVNIVPQVRSVYRWQGEIETSSEQLLIIKSRRERVDEIREILSSLHSYEVPELIALPVLDGLAPYLEWIDHETIKDS